MKKLIRMLFGKFSQKDSEKDLFTRSQLDAAYMKGHTDGYQLGHKDGYEEGTAEGYNTARENALKEFKEAALKALEIRQ